MDKSTKLMFIIIIAGFSAITAILYNSTLVPEGHTRLHEVSELNFPQNEFFEIHEAKLYAKDDIIAVNEFMILQLNVTNKQPLLTGIFPEVYTWIGNNPPEEQHLQETIFGLEYGPAQKSNWFRAGSIEGENLVQVALRIDLSNETHRGYVNATTILDVLSVSSAIQERQNETLFLGVIVTGLVGIGTIGALIWTMIESKKERKLLESQNKILLNKERPWIIFTGPEPSQIIYQDGTTKSYNVSLFPEDPKKPLLAINVSCHYENKGAQPARNMNIISHVSETQFTKEDLENMQKEETKRSLGPGQEQRRHIIDLEKNRWNELITKPLYIGLIITYEIDDVRGVSGGIYEFSNRRVGVIETWYV